MPLCTPRNRTVAADTEKSPGYILEYNHFWNN